MQHASADVAETDGTQKLSADLYIGHFFWYTLNNPCASLTDALGTARLNSTLHKFYHRWPHYLAIRTGTNAMRAADHRPPRVGGQHKKECNVGGDLSTSARMGMMRSSRRRRAVYDAHLAHGRARIAHLVRLPEACCCKGQLLRQRGAEGAVLEEFRCCIQDHTLLLWLNVLQRPDPHQLHVQLRAEEEKLAEGCRLDR